MGSIIKGSVMDKVTNVFGSASSQNMGNTNNKESNSATGSGSAASKAAEATSSNAINIPKGKIEIHSNCYSYMDFIKVYFNCFCIQLLDMSLHLFQVRRTKLKALYR
jgi:hypothetical protein